MDFPKRHFDTLTEATNTLLKEGFEHNFRAEAKGLRDTDADKTYPPSQIEVLESHRFEGMTNPGDSSEILALQTQDGTKGTLVHSHGAKHSQDADMLRALQNQVKKR